MRKFLNRIFNKKTIVTVSRRTVGTLTAFIGLLGLSVIFLNPMSLVAPLLPLSIEGWLYIEQSYVQNSFHLYSETTQNITIEVTKNNQSKTMENFYLNENLIVGIAG